MKRTLTKMLTFIMCSVILVTVTAVSISAVHPFTDVPVWADEYVSEVYEDGIMNGTDSSGKVFNPNGSFTREQLVVTLYRMSGSNVTGTTASLSKTFADGADVSSWAVNAVEWAVKENITSGINQGGKLYFKPQADVTRQEAAKFFITYIDYMKLEAPTDNKAELKDMATVGSWALPYVERCIAAGIINGDGNGNFDPTGKTIRVAAAKMLACLPEPGTHYVEKVDGTAPTCEENGIIEHWKCINCGKLFSDEAYKNEISDATAPATGHTEIIDAAVPPTCEETGLTEGKHCSICEKVIIKQEVVAKTGHTLTATEAKTPTFDDKGNIAYWQCDICSKYYSDAKATNEITKADTVLDVIPSYTIAFVDDKHEPIIVRKRFAQNDDLLLKDYQPEPIVGYTFDGWFSTKTFDPVSKEDYILAGNTDNLDLYAKWTPIEYTITYKDAPVHNNPEKYTVNDNITLAPAEWSGLSFKNWTNENGDVVTSLGNGNIGNMTLYANWVYEENLAVPSKDTSVKSIVYDDVTNRYYFVYDLGVIDNIVIETIGSNDKNAGIGLTLGKAHTTNISKTLANTVSNAISHTISKTDSWSKNFTEKAGVKLDIKAGMSLSAFSVLKLETSLGLSSSTEVSESYGTNGSMSDSEVSSETASSTVSYVDGSSLTVEAGYDIPGKMPVGTYNYVCVGRVNVYGVVIYDPVTGEFYLDTYSVLDSKFREKVLYEAPSNTTVNITYSEGLSFDAHMDAQNILDHLNSVYYVTYDSNGGEGEQMLSSVHKIGEQQQILENTYTRTGYTFLGWSTTPDGGVLYSDKAIVANNLCDGNMVAKLYAVWNPHKYSIEYNANGGGGVMAKSEHFYDVSKNLSANEFVRAGYNFLGWSRTSDAKVAEFTDTESVVNLTSADGEEIQLYAVWKAKEYKVTYIANGGTGSTVESTHTYGVGTAFTTNGFTRTDYIFLGWSKNQNDIVPTYEKDKTYPYLSDDGENVTLYAVWGITKYSGTFTAASRGGSDPIIDQAEAYYETIKTGFQKDLLIKADCTKVSVYINFDVGEIDDGYQILMVYSDYSKDILAFKKDNYESYNPIFGNDRWDNHTAEFTFDLENLSENGVVTLVWDAGGTGSDKWYLGRTTFTLTVS